MAFWVSIHLFHADRFLNRVPCENPRTLSDVSTDKPAERVRHLRMEQRHDVAPRAEGTRLLVHPVDPGQFRH